MDIYNNHKKLFSAALWMFLILTMLVAIVPALQNDRNYKPLPGTDPLTADEMAGKMLYISNGCVACHTQQVRNVDMDKMWGARPSIANDYARVKRTDFWRNTATLMGTERTGPDLTSIGTRQPSLEWHLLHLYQPRSVVEKSIMPAYPWLFKEKKTPEKNDVVINVPEKYRKATGKIVATKEALQLVAYLQSLKQPALPDGRPSPEFLYKRAVKAGKEGTAGIEAELDGGALYAANCQMCHQANGEGLQGAFPALKGSSIVLNADLEIYVGIIMNGYSAREKEGFPSMPGIGTNNNLQPEEVAAIINHERTNWGNNAAKVTVADIKGLMEKVKAK